METNLIDKDATSAVNVAGLVAEAHGVSTYLHSASVTEPFIADYFDNVIRALTTLAAQLAQERERAEGATEELESWRKSDKRMLIRIENEVARYKPLATGMVENIAKAFYEASRLTDVRYALIADRDKYKTLADTLAARLAEVDRERDDALVAARAEAAKWKDANDAACEGAEELRLAGEALELAGK